MAYAEGTSVSAERTQAEIRLLLAKFGADEFGVLEGRERVAITFRIFGLLVRIDVPIPSREDKSFTMTTHRTPRKRSDDDAFRRWNQEVRRRWRALLLAVKAKLEAVHTGISTVEQEFLAFVVTDKGLVGELLIPRLKSEAASGKMPRLLTAG